MTKIFTLSREQARDVDRRATENYGMPSIVMMENAGGSVTTHLLAQKPRGPMIICCGKGNNAGDGFVIARHLDNHQIPVQVILFADPNELTKDAKTNYDILVHSGIQITHYYEQSFSEVDLLNLFSSAEWIIDALFGTGLQGLVRAPFDIIIHAINHSKKKILAVDIPSGLDCDLGKPLGIAVKAQQTLTFVALKKGFSNPEAKPFIGHVEVIDIGIPRKLIGNYLI